MVGVILVAGDIAANRVRAEPFDIAKSLYLLSGTILEYAMVIMPFDRPPFIWVKSQTLNDNSLIQRWHCHRQPP